MRFWPLSPRQPNPVAKAVFGSEAGKVALLALVAGQDVEPADGSDGRWRIARKSREKKQDGFKAHIVIEPDTGLVTAADTSVGVHDQIKRERFPAGVVGELEASRGVDFQGLAGGGEV